MEEEPLAMKCILVQNEVSQHMMVLGEFNRNKPFTITSWCTNGIHVKLEQNKMKFQFSCLHLAYHRNSAKILQ